MGVFQAAIALRDAWDTEPCLSDELRCALKWFDQELPAPDDVDCRAVFWYRSDADGFIRATWRMAALIQAGGSVVYPITCKYPGKIVYMDDFQVAAVPTKEVRRKL